MLVFACTCACKRVRAWVIVLSFASASVFAPMHCVASVRVMCARVLCRACANTRSLGMHRYWTCTVQNMEPLVGSSLQKQHRNSFLPVMMSASWRKRAPSWKDRKYQLWNRRRARIRPVRYDAKRSEHRVSELNRERKKDNTLNSHR